MTTTAKAVRVAHFDLPALPYGYDALEPVISKETLQLHHDKHHRKYVDTMNQLLEKENVRLKRIVAELELDKSILKEALQGKY